MKNLISIFISVGLITTANAGVLDSLFYIFSSYQRCIQDTMEEVITSHAYYDYLYPETIIEAEEIAYYLCDNHPKYREEYGLD